MFASFNGCSSLSFSAALQHGDGRRSRRVGLRLRGSRPAAQPFPPLRLLADAAGAAGHAWKQHHGHHKRGQQQRKHQQPGVVQQPAGPGQGQGARQGQPRHLRPVEVLGGSRGGSHLRLHI